MPRAISHHRAGRWRLALLLCFVVFVGACGGEEGGDGDGALTDATPDATSADDAAPADDAHVGDAAFILGVNAVYDARPQAFTALVDGAEVPITFGAQGAWMFVVAFKTRGLFETTLDISCQVTLDGQEAGRAHYTRQETYPGGDGYDYYYNFFLALTRADAPARGTPFTLNCHVEDEWSGVEVDETHELLVGPTIE